MAKKGAAEGRKKKGAPPEGIQTREPGPDDTSREKVAELILLKPPGEVKFRKIENHPLVVQILNQYVMDWKRGHSADKRPRPYFYVSDAGRCARQLVYQFIQPEDKFDISAKTIILFKMGDLFHDELQNMMMRIGATTSKDVEFGTFGKMDFDPRGRLDVILTEQVAGADVAVIADIKSKNSFAMESEPSIEEVLQLSIYMYQCKQDKYFEKRGQKIADYGYLIYVDRGGMADPPYVVWRIEYDEALVATAREWFARVWAKVQAKELPDRPYTRDSLQCSYCRFKGTCWAEFPEVVPAPSEKDLAIVPPSFEIVESMAKLFVNTRDQIKELQRDVDAAEAVLTQYFKGTGFNSLPVGEITIKYEDTTSNEIDIDYLMKYAKDHWAAFAKPQITMLREAVKAGVISGTVFAKAVKEVPGKAVKVRKPKKEKGPKEGDNMPEQPKPVEPPA